MFAAERALAYGADPSAPLVPHHVSRLVDQGLDTSTVVGPGHRLQKPLGVIQQAEGTIGKRPTRRHAQFVNLTLLPVVEHG